jgi:hypothetical protein
MKKGHVIVRAKVREEAKLILDEEIEEYIKVIKVPEDVEERYSTRIVKRESVLVFITLPRV